MKISIYNEPRGTGIGGSEFLAAMLCEALAKQHHVHLFHRIPTLRIEKLGANSGTQLENVQLHFIDSPDHPSQLSHRNPLKHYRGSRSILAELSEDYDIFIAIVHGVPPFSHAKRRSALIVLFPTAVAPYLQAAGGVDARLAIRHPGRYLYQSWLWKKRMESYGFKTAISDFSRLWTQKRWGIDCTVVYPPVDTTFAFREKERIILSVGRFALDGDGHRKNQEQMLEVYSGINQSMLSNWKYFCVGGLDLTPAHTSYFQRLSVAASAMGAEVLANLTRNELTELYQCASIYWHAAGYDQDQNTQPTLMEHFGISTVEAMAAGCVPIVINKGGQSEIVQHGVSGFLWETLDELRKYTGQLMDDDNLRLKMAAAARKRAQTFSRNMFVSNFVGPLLV